MKRCRMCEKQIKERTFRHRMNEKNDRVEHLGGEEEETEDEEEERD